MYLVGKYVITHSIHAALHVFMFFIIFQSFSLSFLLTNINIVTNCYIHSLIFHNLVSYSRMSFIVLRLIYVATFALIDAVSIGLVRDVSLIIPSYNSLTVYASSCNDCLCAMCHSNSTDPILSFNCYLISSNQVECEMLTASAYNNSHTFLLRRNASSTFYFRQLPSENELVATTVVATTTISGECSKRLSTFIQSLMQILSVCSSYVLSLLLSWQNRMGCSSFD